MILIDNEHDYPKPGEKCNELWITFTGVRVLFVYCSCFLMN